MNGSVVDWKLCPPASEAKAMSRTATVPRRSRGRGSLRGEAKARSKCGVGGMGGARYIGRTAAGGKRGGTEMMAEAWARGGIAVALIVAGAWPAHADDT